MLQPVLKKSRLAEYTESSSTIQPNQKIKILREDPTFHVFHFLVWEAAIKRHVISWQYIIARQNKFYQISRKREKKQVMKYLPKIIKFQYTLLDLRTGTTFDVKFYSHVNNARLLPFGTFHFLSFSWLVEPLWVLTSGTVRDDSFVLFYLSMEIHLAFEKIGHAQKVASPRPAAISGYG